VAGHRDDDLADETPAEGDNAVSELLALLVGHELVSETVLEGIEATERGAAPLCVGYPHGEDVLARLTPELVVRAAAGLGGVVHAVGAWAGAARDQVDARGDALYLVAALLEETEGALGARVGGNFLVGVPYSFGSHGAYTSCGEALSVLAWRRTVGAVSI
jgi:hypothetical protein